MGEAARIVHGILACMKDFETRKAEFLEFLKTVYREKMVELQCDMMSVPLYVPDGQGGFRVVIDTSVVDISNSPMKSPFQTQ